MGKFNHVLTKQQIQHRAAKKRTTHGSVQQKPGTVIIATLPDKSVWVQSQNSVPTHLVCFGCHKAVRLNMVTEHLKQCQPHGASCGKCDQIIKPDGFLEHFMNCNGTKEPSNLASVDASAKSN